MHLLQCVSFRAELRLKILYGFFKSYFDGFVNLVFQSNELSSALRKVIYPNRGLSRLHKPWGQRLSCSIQRLAFCDTLCFKRAGRALLVCRCHREGGSIVRTRFDRTFGQGDRILRGNRLKLQCFVGFCCWAGQERGRVCRNSSAFDF